MMNKPIRVRNEERCKAVPGAYITDDGHVLMDSTNATSPLEVLCAIAVMVTARTMRRMKYPPICRL